MVAQALVRSDARPQTNAIARIGLVGDALIADSEAHENARDKRALPRQRCRCMPADTAPVRALRFGRSDRAAWLALTIQIVANQQRDALRKQQRGV